MRPCTFYVSSFPASPLKDWGADCFGNWRDRSSMVPKLRQHENFLTSNFCIPGLARIPNPDGNGGFYTELCFFSKSSLTRVCCHFRCLKKVNLFPCLSPSSLSLGSTMLALVCVCTMCPDWSPGSLTPPALSQADFKEIYDQSRWLWPAFLQCTHTHWNSEWDSIESTGKGGRRVIINSIISFLNSRTDPVALSLHTPPAPAILVSTVFSTPVFK